MGIPQSSVKLFFLLQVQRTTDSEKSLKTPQSLAQSFTFANVMREAQHWASITITQKFHPT
jgi:hypothetical protein